jgi:hypothetical protein
MLIQAIGNGKGTYGKDTNDKPGNDGSLPGIFFVHTAKVKG